MLPIQNVCWTKPLTQQKKPWPLKLYPYSTPSAIHLEFKMIATEQARYEELYTRHLRALKLQGKRDKTIDKAYLISLAIFH
jgi:hypothetical protein